VVALSSASEIGCKLSFRDGFCFACSDLDTLFLDSVGVIEHDAKPE
jgi:hypothetical protein